jgi:hypothetical protein
MCVLKSRNGNSFKRIGVNQHEEVVGCTVFHGELGFNVVLYIVHGYRCTGDIPFYRLICNEANLLSVVLTGSLAG